MSTTTTTGTLAAGESKTFTLAPGAAVSLTLSPNIRVTITETPESVSGSGVGGNTSRVHEPQLPGTFAYGPYAMGGVVVVAVASNSGSSVAWTRKDTVVTTDSTGTSLVSGDGRVIPIRGYLNDGFSTQAPLSIANGASSTWASDNSTIALSAVGASYVHPDFPQVSFSSITMTPNNATARAVLLSQTQFVLNDTFTLAVAVSGFPSSGAYFKIAFSSDNFATKSIVYAWDSAAAYRPNGVIYLTLGTNETGSGNGGGINSGAGFFSVGGQLITDTFNSVKVELYGLSGIPVKLLGVWSGKKQKGKLILGFDDCLESQYNIVYPYCKDRGIPLTLALTSGLIGLGGYMTLSQATDMYANGMVDFVGHGQTHTVMTSLTAAQVLSEANASKTYLADNGFLRGIDCMVYPENAYNASVLALCRRAGYRFARSAARYYISDYVFGMDDAMSMGSRTLSGVTLAQAKAVIDAANATGQTVWLYGHKILDQNNPSGVGGPPPGTATEWYKDDFYALIDYAASSSISKVSWSDFQSHMLSVPPVVVA